MLPLGTHLNILKTPIVEAVNTSENQRQMQAEKRVEMCQIIKLQKKHMLEIYRLSLHSLPASLEHRSSIIDARVTVKVYR